MPNSDEKIKFLGKAGTLWDQVEQYWVSVCTGKEGKGLVLEAETMLARIRELRLEMERIYAMANDMASPELLRVSRELDLLLVQYLQNNAEYSEETVTRVTGS